MFYNLAHWYTLSSATNWIAQLESSAETLAEEASLAAEVEADLFALGSVSAVAEEAAVFAFPEIALPVLAGVALVGGAALVAEALSYTPPPLDQAIKGVTPASVAGSLQGLNSKNTLLNTNIAPAVTLPQDNISVTNMAPKSSKNQNTMKSAVTTTAQNNDRMLSGKKRKRDAPKALGNKRQKTSGPAGVFGAVSRITTAPVAIGNAVAGSDPIVVAIKDGVRVKGRDFFLSIDPTAASITGWTLTAGAPITPSCLVASILKNFSNTYSQYMIHGVAFHFITSETTANSGSVLLYVGKDRAGPGLIPSSTNMLPFVMSDHCTVLSPLWQNASNVFLPAPQWRTTGLGNDEELTGQAPGELFVLTKSAAITPPGYILMDFDISFRNIQSNIKNLTFPITRMKYTQLSINRSALAVVKDTTTFTFNIPQVGGVGTLMDNITPSAVPSGALVGDIYKLIFNTVSNSTLTTVAGTTLSLANIISINNGPAGNPQTVTMTDGFTAYMVVYNSTQFGALYPNYASAQTDSNAYTYGLTGTYTFALTCYASFVGTVGNTTLQANY